MQYKGYTINQNLSNNNHSMNLFIISLLLLCFFICSLDPDNDPLCMLLLFDFLCLRCREYTALIRLYEEWEVKIHPYSTHLIFHFKFSFYFLVRMYVG